MICVSLRLCVSASRFNLNGSAVGDQGPDLVHFGVGHGDAAVGPVGGVIDAGLEAVDHDVAAGVEAGGAGAVRIGGARVGNVKREVVLALGVAAVDHVTAF